MRKPSNPIRQIVLWISLLLSLVLLIVTIQEFIFEYESPINDFVEYWSAGQLNLAGQNPYDPDLLFPLQKAVGWIGSEPDMMWNPPWTLSVVMPFGIFSYRLSWLLWMAASFAAMWVSSVWIWRIYEGDSTTEKWLPPIIAFTFMPVFMALNIGQITPFILLGLAGFLYFEQSRRDFIAGVFLFLMTIKPHVFFLMGGISLLWLLRQRRWRIGMGLIVAVLLGTLIAFIPNPDVLSHYLSTIQADQPTHWLTPSWGTVLRMIFRWDIFELQFIPPILGAFVAISYYSKFYENWSWRTHGPQLLIISSLTLAYGWITDWIVLLVPVLQVTVAILKLSERKSVQKLVWVYAAAQALIILQGLLKYQAFWNIWFPPLFLGLFFAFSAKLVRQETGDIVIGSSTTEH